MKMEANEAATVLLSLARRMADRTGNKLASDEPILTPAEFFALGFAIGKLAYDNDDEGG